VTFSLLPITKELQKFPFDCGNPDLNSYFKHYALKNDNLMIGKTFVAVDDSENVAGYMTFSNAQIEAADLPESVTRKLPRYPVPAFRIGKLAVDTRFQGEGVGSWLLKMALQKALDVSASVGIFAVLVDAVNEKAKGFYLRYGFIPMDNHPLTLFLPLATIRQAKESSSVEM